MTMSNLPSIYGWWVRTWHAVNLKPDLAANSSCQGEDKLQQQLTDKPAPLMKTFLFFIFFKMCTSSELSQASKRKKKNPPCPRPLFPYLEHPCFTRFRAPPRSRRPAPALVRLAAAAAAVYAGFTPTLQSISLLPHLLTRARACTRSLPRNT